MGLYHSPRGLYPFQAEHIADAMGRKRTLMVWDTGLGKSHAAMATSAFLVEDDEIDHLVMVVERNKMTEWRDDFKKFTDLDVCLYEGTPKKRLKILDDIPHVMIMTYETGRQDMIVKSSGKNFNDGPLTQALLGKRVMIAYDEMSKLGNRKSLLHRANSHFIDRIEQTGSARVLGLTATPMERNPENFYNLGRLLTPETVGTVRDFVRDHVLDYDLFGNPSKFKNLPVLAEKMGPVMLRKRKTDPDVVSQFPKMVERFSYVSMHNDQDEFYRSVEEHIRIQEDPILDQVGFTLLRMIAGHPASILDSEGELAQEFVRSFGRSKIESMSSSKTESLVNYLQEVALGQGAQVVVFSYFVSVIRLLEKAMADANISHSTNHGQLSASDRDRAKSDFRSGKTSVFLTSSAGERGINLPEATYVVNFDLPTKHTAYVQRLNRISRIGSVHSDTVVAQSFIVSNSIEEGIAKLWLGRNYQSDVLMDGDQDDSHDENFVSHTDRMALLRKAKQRDKEHHGPCI